VRARCARCMKAKACLCIECVWVWHGTTKCGIGDAAVDPGGRHPLLTRLLGPPLSEIPALSTSTSSALHSNTCYQQSKSPNNQSNIKKTTKKTKHILPAAFFIFSRQISPFRTKDKQKTITHSPSFLAFLPSFPSIMSYVASPRCVFCLFIIVLCLCVCGRCVCVVVHRWL